MPDAVQYHAFAKVPTRAFENRPAEAFAGRFYKRLSHFAKDESVVRVEAAFSCQASDFITETTPAPSERVRDRARKDGLPACHVARNTNDRGLKPRSGACRQTGSERCRHVSSSPGNIGGDVESRSTTQPRRSRFVTGIRGISRTLAS